MDAGGYQSKDEEARKADIADTAVDMHILAKAPKVELHVHLDGAFHLQTLYKYALANPAVIDEQVTCFWPPNETIFPREKVQSCKDIGEFKALVTSKGRSSLWDMLKCFYHFLPIVKDDLKALTELAYEFVKNQAAQNIIYTEVRYSPHEFLRANYEETPKDNSKGPMATDVVDAVTEGIRHGERECDVSIKQILCCVNGRPSWSEELVQIAIEKRQSHDIVGVDIASGEQHFEDKDEFWGGVHKVHEKAMQMAHSAGMPITVHAGESGGAKNVLNAMEVYKATRIGHGYNVLQDDGVYAQARKKAHFEVCPTSSMETGTFTNPDWTVHPMVQFVKDARSDGNYPSINTDDPSVFECSIMDEYRRVLEMGLTVEDIKNCNLCSIDHAFCDNELKGVMRKTIESYYAS